MAITDSDKTKLDTNLVAPRAVTVDTETVANHSIPDQLLLRDRLASEEVTAGRKATGLRITRINAPGALGRDS